MRITSFLIVWLREFHNIQEHFIILFEQGEYINGAECYLYENILKDHQVILGKKWLGERNATFNKTTNILRICDWGVYYHFQVMLVGVVPFVQELLDKKQV